MDVPLLRKYGTAEQACFDPVDAKKIASGLV